MRELLFMEPYFKTVLWGGHKMKDYYNYPIPGDDTGEAWVVSGNEHGQSVVKNGVYQGKTVGELWKDHRELFGDLEGDAFPLLVKIIDANDDLSIQVHPDDAYAQEHENWPVGKTECWYVLDCEPDAEIVVGHHAQTKEELNRMIDAGEWEKLLNRFPIHKGDFFFIPSGTVHAICRGTLMLEIQQNCDLTYRLYDYGRLQNGQPRELHLDKSKDVMICPHKEQSTVQHAASCDGYSKRVLAECPLFTVEKWEVIKEAKLNQKYPFLIIDVMQGEGQIDGQPMKAGDHILVPAGYGEIAVDGQVEMMVSHV